MGNFISGLTAGAQSLFASFTNPTVQLSAKPTSTVSSQIQLRPFSSTFSKDVKGNSVLSVPAQVQVTNPFGFITEFLGKALNPVATGVTAGASSALAMTSPKPVVTEKSTLGGIFALGSDIINLGANIFGITSTGSQATVAGGNSPLNAPSLQPAFTTYPSSTPPTSSIVSRESVATNVTTNNTGGIPWWIIILLAVIAIVAITRKG